MKSYRHHIVWRIVLQILSALCLVIGINYLSSDHYYHLDYSRSHRFSLSDQGSILFAGIKQPAHIIIYFSPTSLTEGSELYGDVEALMKEYKIKARENLIIEYLDPARHLLRAREVQAKYKFNPDENVIVIDYLQHSRVIPIKELGDYDRSGITEGKPPRLVAFSGEQVINAALIELSGVPLKKIYFLQGHGEAIPDHPPFKIIGRYLQRQHITVNLLNLASIPEVPSDAALVVIAGAHIDLSQTETESLKKFWNSAGRLFVLLDPQATTPLLNQFVEEAGITPHLDRIVLTSSSEKSTSDEVTGEFISGSELTKHFSGLNISLLGATESLILAASSPENEIHTRPLIKVAPAFQSNAEDTLTSTDPSTSLPLNFNYGQQAALPVIIAAMADRGAPHDDRVAIDASRMVVVGNSDFINDKNIGEIDLDFFSSALNELINRIQLTGNTAKMKTYLTLNLSTEDLNRICLWCIIFIPGLAALFSFIMIWRRRL